ncbi:MAG TPA: hypothetical protein DD740_00610 [Chryseobacterium sp.]|nr:hypothetical protein [Chryseobacterium sp.]
MITEMFAQNSSANKTVEGKIIQLLDQADELKYSDWKKSAQLITLADKLSEKSNDDGLRATFYKKAALIYYDRDIFDVSLKYNMTAYDYYKILVVHYQTRFIFRLFIFLSKINLFKN